VTFSHLSISQRQLRDVSKRISTKAKERLQRDAIIELGNSFDMVINVDDCDEHERFQSDLITMCKQVLGHPLLQKSLECISDSVEAIHRMNNQ